MLREKILIYPERLKQLGEAEGCHFYLVTNSAYKEIFQIEGDAHYKSSSTLSIDSEKEFTKLLNNSIPDNSHILVISPDHLIHSVKPNKLHNKKLLIFACNSAPSSLEAIQHFLRCGERTDPEQQELFTKNLFDKLESTENLLLVDDHYKTRAIFDHLDEEYGWHEQAGFIDWGQQQVFPSGEIACFLVPLKGHQVNFNERMKINGDISLCGHPILHSGPPSFRPEDQERIYQALATMRHHAVIATASNGVITKLSPTNETCIPAANMLETLFRVDSRFRIIYEVGFALNSEVSPYPENSAMNEVSASKTGSLHFGLGMLPYTQYHLDIICPSLSILTKNGDFIFGAKPNGIKRIKSTQCPCLGYA